MGEAALQQEFSLQTHVRDEKTGRLIYTDHYKFRNHKGAGLFERPVGSGNLRYKNGEVAGRWIDGKWAEKTEHIAWIAPETKDQRLAKTIVQKDEKIRHLEKELIAIRREAKYGPSMKPEAQKPGQVIVKGKKA